jgi:hypothetical protein
MITTAKRSLFSLFALLFAFTALFSPQAVDAATGTVGSVKGNVTVNGNPVKKGDQVSSEGEFVVPPGGSAVIDFGPGIGKVTLQPGTTASIFVGEGGALLVVLKGEGGGAVVDGAGSSAVVRDNAGNGLLGSLLGGGGGGGIGGSTGLGLAGLPTGSTFGGGGGVGSNTTTLVLPNGSVGLFDEFGRFLGLVP